MVRKILLPTGNLLAFIHKWSTIIGVTEYEALINTAYREYNEAAMGKGKRTAEESRKKNC